MVVTGLYRVLLDNMPATRQRKVTNKDNGRSDDGISIALAPQAPPKTGGHEPRPEREPSSSAGKEREKIYGVFSTELVAMVGTGTTKRKDVKRALWFAEEITPEEGGEPVIQIQPVNNKNVPSGNKKTVPLSEFLADYTPEFEYYQTVVFPKMKELDSTLRHAEEQRDKGAYYSAQFGFEAALEFDERNVRANFGLGLTYIARGDTDKAADIFKQVVALDAAFNPEHKHLFNEFGINLRKSRLFDQAVEYYTRALEMTRDDENLYYNIARAHFERGDRDSCRESLVKALELKPDFEAAQEFLAHLDKQEPHPDVSLD
jgi:tetratricopeptide (TPR) repeat protein